jgi:small subunit ribosomal protein S15
MESKLEKSKVIKENARHEKDTGSTEVQVALITDRIAKLTEHLKVHKKDHHSRRGLFMMINQRRKLLKYLFRSDSGRYDALIVKLGIRSIVARG